MLVDKQTQRRNASPHPKEWVGYHHQGETIYDNMALTTLREEQKSVLNLLVTGPFL